MRKRLWQLHSWLGLICGLALLVIGLSGSLLVFHEELEAWINPHLVSVEPMPSGRLAPGELLARVRPAVPGYEVTGWLYNRHAPQLADVAYVIEHGTTEWKMVTVNPYTGTLLGGPMTDHALLTGWLLELHYTFFSDHAGLWISGFLGLGLCALGLTGVWIYRRFWKSLLTLRWGESRRIFLSDLHRMVGISSVAFNLVLGFTGAYWNLTHVIGEWVMGEPDEVPVPGPMLAAEYPLEAVIADARTRLPGFQANYISLPWVAGGDVTLWGSFEDAGVLRSPYGSTATYDAQTGANKGVTDIRAAGAWAQAVDSFRPLHFGDFGGLPVQLLWCFAGLTPGILAVSGTCIWWLRRRKAVIAARRGELSAKSGLSPAEALPSSWNGAFPEDVSR